MKPRAGSKRIYTPNQLEYGFPPKIEDFFGEITTAYSRGWDYELWVEEWAEPYLGTVQFNSLAPKFASISQVTEVVHEDRERFILKSKADANNLKMLLWQKFLEAANDAHVPFRESL